MSVSHSASRLLHNPKVRNTAVQALVVVLFLVVAYEVTSNLITNLRRANIHSGFDFLSARAGFEIDKPLIDYNGNSTYGRALVVGLLNTILVAVAGIILSTIVGFMVGVGRLSRNWLLAKICTVYVETFRNLPPLLVIFFLYIGILQFLPQPRQSVRLPLGVYLNNRGITFPRPIFEDGFGIVLIAVCVAVLASFLAARWARARQAATGKQFHTVWTSVGFLVAVPLLAFLGTGRPIAFDYPTLGTFNLKGGAVIGPEFIALLLALSLYTASYIAEIVRSGILGVPQGQTEASKAMGLSPSATMRLVVLPQAFRIIIPPLTSQYLNLTKNSSLAIAIGYSDLVAVGGTILNQTGQAVEVITIWMATYLCLSLATSAFMNWFNSKMALVER
ncbi:MAG: amino acid ABC transporter permease [Rhizobiales bacterium]|nr:amino acid ABC transporter permease [Hyphomicrobiales bacterium]